MRIEIKWRAHQLSEGRNRPWGVVGQFARHLVVGRETYLVVAQGLADRLHVSVRARREHEQRHFVLIADHDYFRNIAGLDAKFPGLLDRRESLGVGKDVEVDPPPA